MKDYGDDAEYLRETENKCLESMEKELALGLSNVPRDTEHDSPPKWDRSQKQTISDNDGAALGLVYFAMKVSPIFLL